MQNRKTSCVIGALVCAALLMTATGEEKANQPRLIRVDGSVVESAVIWPVASRAESDGFAAIAFEYAAGPETHRVPLDQVFLVTLQNWVKTVVTSDASVMALSLGNEARSNQPPPGWSMASVVGQQGWKPAVATVNAPCMFYLPEAHWVWTSADEFTKPRFERALFQKSFDLPAQMHITQAIISLVGCHHLNALYVNGQKVNRDDDQLCMNVVRYDVADSLAPGPNILAFDITAPRDETHGYGGLGFRLEVMSVESRQPASESPVVNNSALLLSSHNVIKGQLIAITDNAFLIRHAGGDTSICREWVDSAQFAPANGEPVVNPALTDKGGCGLHTISYSSARLAADETMPARIVDRYGRVIAGEVLAMDKHHRVLIEHEKNMPPMMLDLNSIQEINFVRPKQFDICQMKPEQIGRVARVHTTDGNAWHGVLTSVTDGELILDTPYAGTIALQRQAVAQIVFPFQAVAAAVSRPRSGNSSMIGIIGEFQTDINPTVAKVAATVHVLGKAMGYEVIHLHPSDVLNTEIFSSQKFHAVVNVDARQKSYDGWDQTDDVKNALIHYIEQGGNLIHLAPGTPFYLGSQRVEGRWVVKPCAESFNRRFGLHVAFLGEPIKHGMCIERPDNSAKQMTFVSLPVEGAVLALPQAIAFNAARDTQFRPVNAMQSAGSAGEFIPLYKLISDKGEDYGHAAAISRVPNKAGGTSIVAYVAFPLVMSEWEGVPAVNFLFPWLMEMINQN